MNKQTTIITGLLCYVTCSIALANPLSDSLYSRTVTADGDNFTLLDATAYHQTVTTSRATIQQLLQTLQPYRQQSLNDQVATIAQQFTDIPYEALGASGEGDWQPNAITYQGGATHIQQDPVYRVDSLDCQTFVQVAMALLYSKNLNQFDKNYLHISYGAAGNPQGQYVRYYNRNNFVDADFNPVNERLGRLTDVTAQDLKKYAAIMTATITRQHWFIHQQEKLAQNVRVLTPTAGPAMAQRMLTTYANLNFPNFAAEKIAIAYLPKTLIALKQADGNYQPNDALLAELPLPAVAEIIRDPKLWLLNNKKIYDAIGSELTVSHMGLLYRQTFQYGDIIYQDIQCSMNNAGEKTCDVKPVTCSKQVCNEVMFAHATDRFPNNFYWYQLANGNYACSATPPAATQKKIPCNRVAALPLFDYLTDYQYGNRSYMNNDSIVGIHLEQLRG
jgi:hypothetical protein